MKKSFIRFMMAFAILFLTAVSAEAQQGVRILTKGSRGPEVAVLQKDIGARIDGVFGPETSAKLKAWQAKNGLEADGDYGLLSRAVMEKRQRPIVRLFNPSTKTVEERRVTPVKPAEFAQSEAKFPWSDKQEKEFSLSGDGKPALASLTWFRPFEMKRVKVKKNGKVVRDKNGKPLTKLVNNSDYYTDKGLSASGLKLRYATATAIGICAVIPWQIEQGSLIVTKEKAGIRRYLAADNPEPSSHRTWIRNVAKRASTAAQRKAVPIDLCTPYSNTRFDYVKIIPYPGKKPFMKLTKTEKAAYLDLRTWGIKPSGKPAKRSNSKFAAL